MATQQETLKAEVEAAYQSLIGLEFKATYNGQRTMDTGYTRSLLVVKPTVENSNLIEALGEICSTLGDQPVWKGITEKDGEYTLWIQGDPQLAEGTFRIRSCEVIEGLPWKNPKYKALVNIEVDT